MSPQALLALLGLLTLASTQTALAVLPNQPPTFSTARSALSPIVAYSFRQTQCLSGTIVEDINNQLSLTRLLSSSVCPSTVVGGNSFASSSIGVTINSTNEASLKSASVIAPALNNIIVDAGAANTKSLSLEIWFSFSSVPADGSQTVLFEIGGGTGSTDTLGFDADGYQLRLSYKKNPGSPDQLFLDYVFEYGSPSTQDVAPRVILANPSNNAGFRNNLEALGMSSGTIYQLVVTLASDHTLVAYITDIGNSTSGMSTTLTNGNSFGTPIRNFPFRSDAFFRMGSTRSPSPTLRSLIGTVYFAALYNAVLSQSQVNSLLAGGLPNSNPSVRSVTFTVNEDSDDLINLNQVGVVVYDRDGNTVTSYRIKTFPSLGTLSFAGTPITTTDFLITNPTLLKYRAPADTSSSPYFSTYDTFTFTASDGICDSNSTLSTDANCQSAFIATANIVVTEVNDPPEIVSTQTQFPVFAESANPTAFFVTCKDRDDNATAFGLSRIRLLNQTRPDLGKVYIVENGTGACTGGTLIAQMNVALSTVNMSQVATKNQQYSWKFCYNASATTLTTVDVGTDVITFQCEDRGGLATIGTVAVNVKNALIAGCGSPSTSRAQWAAGVKCQDYAIEDNSLFIRLTGFDAVESHNPVRHTYRIDALPPVSTGTLYTLNGTEVVAGVTYPADDGNQVTLASGRNISTLLGNLTLEFRPALNYFTAICGLDKDPNTPAASNGRGSCADVTTPNFRFKDVFNLGFNGCNITMNPSGCPVNFTFSLGYNDTTTNTVQYGEPYVNGFEIIVLGVNDNTTAGLLTAPPNVTMSRTAVDFYINREYNASDKKLRYSDPDGDTYRIGFFIEIKNTRAIVKVPNFENPLFDATNTRLTWVLGYECLESGGLTCKFQGKAYLSDLNRMFDALIVSTSTSRLSNETLAVTVFDPVTAPGEFEPDPSYFTPSLPGNASADIILVIGTPSTAESSALGTALWAGIAAGLFFVAMSCFACIGCLINRARQGEQAAVWVVRNILCTDVEHRTHPDMSKLAAGGRRSLEAAIHAEHTRLARVVCCALFMRRVFPCVKFDTDAIKVPDEEDMLQEAVAQTKKRIASMHRPKDVPDAIPVAAVATEADVEDVVKEDLLADDSIFDWERHLDERTGRVFYYNIKTHESRWTPPTVKVHEHHKIADRTSMRSEGGALHSPKPPEMAKPGGASDDADSERVKKAT